MSWLLVYFRPNVIHKFRENDIIHTESGSRESVAYIQDFSVVKIIIGEWETDKTVEDLLRDGYWLQLLQNTDCTLRTSIICHGRYSCRPENYKDTRLRLRSNPWSTMCSFLQIDAALPTSRSSVVTMTMNTGCLVKFQSLLQPDTYRYMEGYNKWLARGQMHHDDSWT